MKLSKKITFLGLVLLLVSLVLAACGDNTSTPNSAPAAAPTTAAPTTAAMTTGAVITTSAAMTTAASTAAMTPGASMAAMTPSAAMTTGAAITTSAAMASSGKEMQITISDFKFAPDTITIPVGTKVIWTNKDSVGHTVTGDDTSGPLKADLIPQGKTFEYTFDKAGTYAYHCTPHPFMKATIIVTPK